MKRFTVAAALVLGVAGLSLTGCSVQTLSFTVADPGPDADKVTMSESVTFCPGITDEDVADLTGTDMGTSYPVPYNMNNSQFNSNACGWSDGTNTVLALGQHKTVVPEQLVGCNVAPFRGDESLKDFGNPGWWTFKDNADTPEGILTACEGSSRVYVNVQLPDAGEQALQQKAEELAKLMFTALDAGEH